VVCRPTASNKQSLAFSEAPWRLSEHQQLERDLKAVKATILVLDSAE